MIPHPPRSHPPRSPGRCRRVRGRILGTLAVAGLFGAALVAPAGAASNADDDPPEQIVNGDFSNGSTAPWWWTENNPASVVDGRLCADIPGDTANPWDAIVGQSDLPLIAGESYTLSYTATASVPVTITTNVQMAVDPYTTELSEHDQISDTAVPITHTFTAKADNDAAQLAFQVGGSSTAVHPVPGRRLAARRRRAARLHARHRLPGPGGPGRLPARRAEGRHRSSPTPPTRRPGR